MDEISALHKVHSNVTYNNFLQYTKNIVKIINNHNENLCINGVYFFHCVFYKHNKDTIPSQTGRK